MDSKGFVRAAAMAAHLAVVVGCHAAPAADSGSAAPQAAAGPTVAYNEAVRVVAGKRVVQLPPLNPYNPKQYVAPASSYVMRVQAFMIETQDGLVQCTVPFFAKEGCEPSTFGQLKRSRTWIVLREREWQACIGIDKPKKCRAIYPKPGSPDYHLGGVMPSEAS